MLGQADTAQLPGKDGIGTSRLQRLTHRAVANQNQPGAGVAPVYGIKGLHEEIQIFLSCKPANKQHREVIRRHTPLRTQPGTAV